MRELKAKQDKREAIRRLKVIEGHLRKVIEMVVEDRYCVDILQQSLAVQRALRKVDEIVLDRHLRTCVAAALGGESAEGGSAPGGKEAKIKEILELFKRRG